MKASIHISSLMMLSCSLVSCFYMKSVDREAQAVKCILEQELKFIQGIQFQDNKFPRLIFLSTNSSPHLSIVLPENYTGIPPSEWLKVMSGMIMPIRSIAHAKFSKKDNCVIDKETGQTGAIINIYSIQWDSNHDIRLVVGVNFGLLDGYGNNYKLKWAKGKWQIIECKTAWLE